MGQLIEMAKFYSYNQITRMC